jgi:hypothetical protein
VALLEWTRQHPSRNYFELALESIGQEPDAIERQRWNRIVSAMIALAGQKYEDALALLEDCPPGADTFLMEQTARFAAELLPDAANAAAVRNPIAVRAVHGTADTFLVLTRSHELVLYDRGTGELESLAPPTSPWYPSPLTWPWIGAADASDTMWCYGVRRLGTLAADKPAFAMNIRTGDIPDLHRYLPGHIDTLVATAMAAPPPRGEEGEFLRGEIQANHRFVGDPDLPTLGFIESFANAPELVQVTLRGGPDVLIDLPSGRAISSESLRERLKLDIAPRFFAKPLLRVNAAAPDAKSPVLLLSTAGLIRWNRATDEVEHIPVPGEVQFPVLIPESTPYPHKDPRWAYFARLPAEGGQVFRLRVEEDRVETVNMVNESLPPNFYRAMSRQGLRDEIDLKLRTDRGYGLEKFIETVINAVNETVR